MRFTLFIVIGLSFFINGIAEEKLFNRFRVNIDHRNLSISDDGITLKTKSVGDVYLSNLNKDERGYYTICELECICTNCDTRFDIFKDKCENCGKEIKFVPKNSKWNEFFTTETLLSSFFNNSNIWNSDYLYAAQVEGSASIAIDGTTSVSVTIGNTNEGNNWNYEIEGNIKDKDGKVEGKIEVTISGKY